MSGETGETRKDDRGRQAEVRGQKIEDRYQRSEDIRSS
jgi:hypothetical protein